MSCYSNLLHLLLGEYYKDNQSITAQDIIVLHYAQTAEQQQPRTREIKAKSSTLHKHTSASDFLQAAAANAFLTPSIFLLDDS